MSLVFEIARSCVFTRSRREKEERSNERNFSSLISALPDHHITHYIKYGLHFIRFGFTPAQTTTSSFFEKFFKKKLRLRQGTVSLFSICRVLKRERREKRFFFFFLSLSFGFGIQFCVVFLFLSFKRRTTRAQRECARA